MKPAIRFLLVIFLSTKALAQGQVVSKNLSLASVVGYQTLYNGQSIDPTQAETITDLATWRDSRNGKEYALLGLSTPGPAGPPQGSGSGVALVDVTNPANPTYVKTIQHPTSTTTNSVADIQVHNNIAYIAQNWLPTYWVNLITAVDNPSNPTAGYGSDITLNSEMRIHNLFVNKDQNLLFLSRFGFDNDKIRVFDINGVPNSAPIFVGEIPQILSG
jgi:hypothetical protein